MYFAWKDGRVGGGREEDPIHISEIDTCMDDIENNLREQSTHINRLLDTMDNLANISY